MVTHALNLSNCKAGAGRSLGVPVQSVYCIVRSRIAKDTQKTLSQKKKNWSETEPDM